MLKRILEKIQVLVQVIITMEIILVVQMAETVITTVEEMEMETILEAVASRMHLRICSVKLETLEELR